MVSCAFADHPGQSCWVMHQRPAVETVYCFGGTNRRFTETIARRAITAPALVDLVDERVSVFDASGARGAIQRLEVRSFHYLVACRTAAAAS